MAVRQKKAKKLGLTEAAREGGVSLLALGPLESGFVRLLFVVGKPFPASSFLVRVVRASTEAFKVEREAFWPSSLSSSSEADWSETKESY